MSSHSHDNNNNNNNSCCSDSHHHEEEKLLNPEALQSNMMGINYVRSLMALVSGIVAGIAGLTGSKGFALYLVIHVITSLCLLIKMKFQVNEYLTPAMTWYWFVLDGITGQGLSFVMFWTLSFAMVHIF